MIGHVGRGAVALLALAGCSDGSASGSAAQAVASPAERACLRDVAAETGNPTVRVERSSFSEAGTEVIVLVGDGSGPYPPAPWRCIAYSDGTTAGIMSLVDEGAL
ncbi:MAG: hypothetical protein JKP98_00165 [Rhodobacteraceae bacterium]|nr:hypothetical protein [Paracoccaceae bacterium]MBL4556206.1 hypothetical protein [Paracoccaceae bacterium]HBG99775.1 hypothetical protein [Paracoccaceae bacterium]